MSTEVVDVVCTACGHETDVPAEELDMVSCLCGEELVEKDPDSDN